MTLPPGVDFVTIEPFVLDGAHIGYKVMGWSEYDESSPLAGQVRRECLGAFTTLEDAKAAWPGATQCSSELAAQDENVSRPTDCPLTWFYSDLVPKDTHHDHA